MFVEFKKEYKLVLKFCKWEVCNNKLIFVVFNFRCKVVYIGNIELKVILGDII